MSEAVTDNIVTLSCNGCALVETPDACSADGLLVCHCFNVYESTVKKVVGNGVQSVSEVMQHCGAGSGCGACHVRIERVLRGMPAKCGSGRFDLCGDCGCIGALCSCEHQVAGKEEVSVA